MSRPDVLLEDVVLDRAAQQLRIDAVLLGDELVEEEEHGRRGIDGHRRRDLVERESGEQGAHVLEAVDGDAHLADFALRAGMVGVVAHLGGQVEGARQTRLAGTQEELEPLVGRLGGAEPGVLAHRPQTAPVHVGTDAPGVREGAGVAEPGRRIPPGEVGGPVDLVDGDPRVGDPLVFR